MGFGRENVEKTRSGRTFILAADQGGKECEGRVTV